MEILKYVEYQNRIKDLLIKQKSMHEKLQFLKQALLIAFIINVCLMLAMIMYTQVVSHQMIALQQANNVQSTINR